MLVFYYTVLCYVALCSVGTLALYYFTLCCAVLCLDTVAQVLVILYCVTLRHELFLLGKQLFLQGCPQNSHIIP